jgi:hypothetical protein
MTLFQKNSCTLPKRGSTHPKRGLGPSKERPGPTQAEFWMEASKREAPDPSKTRRRTRGGAADSLHGLRLDFPEAVDLTDQDRHAQILEAAGVGVAALLYPEIVHAQHLLAEALCPEQVAVALKHAHDVFVPQLLHTTKPTVLYTNKVVLEVFGISLLSVRERE